MTQEQKDLLLKDLCARLPYMVKMNHIADDEHSPKTLIGIAKDMITLQGLGGYEFVDVDHYKPYLFPISSMTEEQKIECFKGKPLEIDKYGDIAVKEDFYGGSQYTDLEIYLEVINWLLKNHFDIYGLIPMGLAMDATGLNIY